jgi:hypothetical protein
MVTVCEPPVAASLSQDMAESAHIFLGCKNLLDVFVCIQSAGFSRSSEVYPSPMTDPGYEVLPAVPQV